MMSCNHCTTKFNFFHKEVGCSNCGLSFCNKCLKQKSKIPSKGSGEFNVCRTCYQKLSSTTSSTSGPTIVTPPDAYLKRLEALENPMTPPITMYKDDSSKIQSLKSGLGPEDIKIVERLEKLKEQGKGPPPSENELRQRLANLKGENAYVVGPSKSISLLTSDTRTDQEKADALLEYFAVERDIELAHNPQNKIEARLACLREQGIRPNESDYIKNLHDSSSSEEEVEKITRKIMDEVALDTRCPVSLGDAKPESPELPWCVLCNKDAKFKCLDCGNDLYCAECNIEVHKNWDEADHKVISYQAPK